MRFPTLSTLLLLAVCFDAAAADIYATINGLRTRTDNCTATKNVPALQVQGLLEKVAGYLAQGDSLQHSLKTAGYRATRSKAISIRGDNAGTESATMLARPAYCPQLMDTAMTEIGVYQDAHQVWIVLAAPFAPSAGGSQADEGKRVLDLVNQARATPRYCGDRMFRAAAPVRWSGTLAEASRLHSEDMARNNYFSHSGRDGSRPAQRVERAGYRYRATGENIAAGGQMKSEDAVAGWIKSPGHCANLMNPAFTEMGAAFAIDANSEMGVYWTQAFGTPR